MQNQKRTIRVKDDHLTSIRTGGELHNLYAFAEDKFYFEHSLTIFEFKKDDQGNVLGILAHLPNGKIGKAKKMDEAIKERKEINLDEKTLQQYVGKYEIEPGADLSFTLENNKLWVEAPGEEKLPIYPEGNHKFFLKVIDADLEFVKKGEHFVEVRVNLGREKIVGIKK